MQMRAVVITAPGGPEVLELREVPRPSPSYMQVLVRVHATALNRADILQRQGRYPAPADAPADIPGMEFAGEVAEIGAGVTRWKTGQRVFGILGGGAYAEYLVTHERMLAEIPDALSYTEAAAVPEAFITAHDALVTQASLRPSETVLIHAVASGVGLAAVQLTRALGAIPFGTARGAGKIDRAKEYGLEDGWAAAADLRELAAHAKRWSRGRGMNIVLDLVGGAYFPASIEAMAPLGRLMVIGTIAGREASIPLGRVLSSRITIRGTMLRGRAIEEKIAATRAFEEQVVPLLGRGARANGVERVHRQNRTSRLVRAGRIAIVAGAAAVAACTAAILPDYRGPRTDHFDGRHFFNEEPFEAQQPSELARWQLTRHRGKWPDSAAIPAQAPPRRVGGGVLRATMVNHATVLLQMDSLNILTDPVWSRKVGLEGALGVQRHRPPGIPFDSLPQIDVVLLSHDHYDHTDLPSLLRLQHRYHPRIITGLGNPGYLASQGVQGAEQLDWWQSASLGRGVRVTAVPARHWSGRSLTDRYERLWEGFVIEGARDTVYFAGDSGWGRLYRELHARWGRFTLALLPVSPFRPRWYMARKHLGPDDAVRVAIETRSAMVIPIHWGTFELGDDGESEAVDTLRAAVSALPTRCRPRLSVLRNGEHVASVASERDSLIVSTICLQAR